MATDKETTAEKSPSMKLIKGTKKTKVAEVEVAEATSTKEMGGDTSVDTTGAESLAPEKEKVELAEPDLIVKVVAEMNSLKEKKAFALVPELLNSIDHDYFKLGGVMATIQLNGWYLDKSYDNFRQYVETECGMQYRKAMYLIGIYNGLSASGVPWEKVKGLGWTMLKELANILTPENVDEWVEAVSSMTVLQAQEYIKIKTAGLTADVNGDAAASVEVKKSSTMTFKVYEDQRETIKEALAKAKHESGTEFDSVALENICIDFLSGDSKIKKAPSLKEMIAGMDVMEVLELVSEIHPHVDISVGLPEETKQEAED